MVSKEARMEVIRSAMQGMTPETLQKVVAKYPQLAEMAQQELQRRQQEKTAA